MSRSPKARNQKPEVVVRKISLVALMSIKLLRYLMFTNKIRTTSSSLRQCQQKTSARNCPLSSLHTRIESLDKRRKAEHYIGLAVRFHHMKHTTTTIKHEKGVLREQVLLPSPYSSPGSRERGT